MSKLICRDREGFTLIEVLIAISIFAVVVVTVYGAYRASFFTIQRSEHRLRSLAKAQVLLERISEDLAGVVLGSEAWFEGGEDSGENAQLLSFRTFARANIGKNGDKTGAIMVRYYLETTDDGEKRLYRSSSAWQAESDLDDSKRGVVLGDDLLSFEIKFIAGDGKETDTWSLSRQRELLQGEAGVARLPALVRIRFAMVGAEKEMSQSLHFRSAVALPQMQ